MSYKLVFEIAPTADVQPQPNALAEQEPACREFGEIGLIDNFDADTLFPDLNLNDIEVVLTGCNVRTMAIDHILIDSLKEACIDMVNARFDEVAEDWRQGPVSSWRDVAAAANGLTQRGTFDKRYLVHDIEPSYDYVEYYDVIEFVAALDKLVKAGINKVYIIMVYTVE